MKTKKKLPSGSSRRTNDSAIVFEVGPYRMGINAASIKEIRSQSGLAPKDFAGAEIFSIHAFFGIDSPRPSNGGQAPNAEARWLVLHHGRLAFRVDRVERMMEIGVVRQLPWAFQGAEREWYCGLALVDRKILPIVNPEALEREARRLAKDRAAPRQALQRSLQKGAS